MWTLRRLFDPSNADRLISNNELSKGLRIGTDTLTRWRKDGLISVSVKKAIIYRVGDVADFLDQRGFGTKAAKKRRKKRVLQTYAERYV